MHTTYNLLMDSSNWKRIFIWHLEFLYAPPKMLPKMLMRYHIKSFREFVKQQYKPLPLKRLSSINIQRVTRRLMVLWCFFKVRLSISSFSLFLALALTFDSIIYPNSFVISNLIMMVCISTFI